MIQRRGVATAAGFAFASQMYQAWNLLSTRNGTALRFSSTHFPLGVKPQRTLRKQCDHHLSSIKLEQQYCSRRMIPQGQHRPFRLFGSKSGSGIPGAIQIQDDQKALLNIDLNRLRQTATEVRKHLACTASSSDYETYDVSIYLVDDEAMKEANNETRKINEPTDILSFQFHDAIEPGKLDEPLLDVPDYYNLGDILIDIPYVIRSCRDDQLDEQDEDTESPASTNQEKQNDDSTNIDDGEDEEEEVWVNDDRGVSGAMAKVFDPEVRINMLLVHGMLHLVGYDHEDDADYELMVTKEEEILDILQRNGILKLPVPTSPS